MPQSRRKISSEVLDTIEEKKIIDETSKKKNIKIEQLKYKNHLNLVVVGHVGKKI